MPVVAVAALIALPDHRARRLLPIRGHRVITVGAVALHPPIFDAPLLSLELDLGLSAVRYNGSMLNIRKATPDDIALILEFIRELAEYERAPEEAMATAEDLRRDGFSGEPRFYVEIAEWDGENAGFALWYFNYSTWQGKPGLYIEDLFVRPRFRKQGVGRGLLVRLARIAVEKGCGRYQWQVLDWNTPAIEFYHSLGAHVLQGWLTMRMSGDGLQKLAAHGKG